MRVSDFKKQFNRLRKRFPNDYVVLSFEMSKFPSDNDPEVGVCAYSSSRGWTDLLPTPMEAVDTILLMEERGEEEYNESD